MRILHVVALLSRDNIYGGPTTVAINQCRALTEMGHTVTLAVGRLEDDLQPIEGIDTRLFAVRNVAPRLGFAALTSPALLRWVHSKATAYDVVHVHMARDLLTLPAAMLSLRRGVPTFLQTHGMIDRSDKALAKPLDRVAVLPTLKQAAGVFCLTPFEERELATLSNGTVKALRLLNGVPAAMVRGPSAREVLFVARLHPRKRPLAFVAAAAQLSTRHPDVLFTLIGPDEGEGAAVREAIISQELERQVVWLGSMTPSAILDRMSRSAVYVLPSVNEPYPMAVLEAMASGVPVVITDTCGLAAEVAAADAGAVVSGDEDELASVLERLLVNDDLRVAMGSRGRRLTKTQFSMAGVAVTLTKAYEAHLLRS